jgi:CBS domain-containing protein
MKVKEIMTANPVKYCSPETNLQDAAKEMKEANVGALPVVDNKQKVIGLVTDRDIALSLASEQTSLSATHVEDIISKQVHTVKAEDNLEDALEKMRTNQIGRLPVTDEEGKLKGIVSVHNLLSQTFEGKTELGDPSKAGENILKTIKAVHERYNDSKISGLLL